MNTDTSGQHKRLAKDVRAACAVLTVSDSRGAENDPGGDLLAKRLEAAGHRIVLRDWVEDAPERIAEVVESWLADAGVQVAITTGGTGISSRDGTVDVIERLLEKRLDGFGELFRLLSYEQVGSAAMLSRATAGVARGTLVFALPGSPAALELALDKLILPELPHLIWERSR